MLNEKLESVWWGRLLVAISFPFILVLLTLLFIVTIVLAPFIGAIEYVLFGTTEFMDSF